MRFLSSFTTLLITASLVGCSSTRNADHPTLPALDDIVSIIVSIEQPEPEIDSFEIPKSDWEDVIATLRAAVVDLEPAKWESAGEMTIESESGETVKVWIYYTRNLNVFSIDKPSAKRTYFRSTQDNATVEAIRKSYSKFNSIK